MDKFLQQFKDNLENTPPPTFDNQDWEDMQQRLAAQQTPPTSNMGRYLAGLAAALLLCSLAFNWVIYDKFQQVSDKISNTEYRKDSMVYTKVIYQTDTIFRTHTIYINTSENSATPPNSNSSSNENAIVSVADGHASLYQSSFLGKDNRPFTSFSYQNPSLWSNGFQQNNATILSNSLWALNNQINQEVENQHLLPAETIKTPLPYLASLPLSPLEYATSPILPLTIQKITESQEKSLRQRLYPFLPKGIALGITTGAGTTLSNNHKGLYILNWGLIGKIKFSDALRLSGSASLATISYQTKTIGDSFGVPTIPFPGDDYELEGIQVNRKIWSADIGMEYSFFKQKKWQPFIGLGFGVSSLTKNEVIYEFEDEMADQYFSETKNYELGKNLQYTHFDMGIAYSMSKKWSAQLSGNYLYRLQKFNNQVPDHLGIKLNILYNF